MLVTKSPKFWTDTNTYLHIHKMQLLMWDNDIRAAVGKNKSKRQNE